MHLLYNNITDTCTFISMFFRDKIINTNTLLAMAAQRSERVQERIVSLLINVTIYCMCLCKLKNCINYCLSMVALNMQ